jgi:hypothetical protein
VTVGAQAAMWRRDGVVTGDCLAQPLEVGGDEVGEADKQGEVEGA